MPRKAQGVKVAPSAQYGQAAAQEAAQKAIPLPNNTGLPAGTPPAGGAPSPVQGPMVPQEQPMPSIGGFDRPTERPGEPITAGLPMGGGPGPEVLPSQNEEVGMQLRALYQAFPNRDLMDLIEAYDEGEIVFDGR